MRKRYGGSLMSCFVIQTSIFLLLLPFQLNMQAAFLISAKGFNEKQVGILFLCFGITQFLFLAPAGYFLDYSDRKIDWVLGAGAAASALTVLTAITAEEDGRNMALMILWRLLQGGVTAILLPGFNGITLGIVGSTGFTHQVSRNRMMNHIGTATVVAFGSLLAYFLYPNIGALFFVSPVAAIGLAYNLRRIMPRHVDTDAARGLIIESPTMNEYEQYDEEQEAAAIEAAALSWQIMKEDQNSDPVKVESQKAEIINQFNYVNSNADPVCSLTSTCGTVPVFPSAVLPSPSVASATSSSYMPPDFLNADLIGKEALQRRNMVLLASPMSENEEGFQLPVSAELRQRQFAWPVSSTLTENGEQLASPSRPNASEADRCPKIEWTYDRGDGFKMDNNKQNSSALSMSHLDANTQQTHCGPALTSEDPPRKARTPFAVLMDPTLRLFVTILFFFHTANSSVLPLVMQSLALKDPQAGILLSGLCIVLAQACMSYFAKVCGDYSPIWGRKNLFLIGLASLTLRCFLLAGLVSATIVVEDDDASNLLKVLILSTQLLDAVGAGIVGCLQILVTNDIAGGTGRFSLMLGVTTGSMCLGGTVSGYIGQAMAQDYGYPFAFTALGIMSLVPFIMYVFFMPETLPDYARPNQQTFTKRRKRLAALFKRLAESRRQLVAKANPFVRRKSKNNDLASDSKEQPLTSGEVDDVRRPREVTTTTRRPLQTHVELV
jgi:MFS family permease